MLTRLSRRFNDYASGWLIVASLLTLAAFMAVTMPPVAAASRGVEGLDTRLFYTPEEAFENVASYTEQGRNVLTTFHLTADLVNPVLYTSFLVLLISWLFQRGFSRDSVLQKLNILPMGAALADLLENACIAIMFSVYPAQPRLVAWFATVGTLTKSVFIFASFALVLLGAVGVMVCRVKKAKMARQPSAPIASRE